MLYPITDWKHYNAMQDRAGIERRKYPNGQGPMPLPTEEELERGPDTTEEREITNWLKKGGKHDKSA